MLVQPCTWECTFPADSGWKLTKTWIRVSPAVPETAELWTTTAEKTRAGFTTTSVCVTNCFESSPVLTGRRLHVVSQNKAASLKQTNKNKKKNKTSKQTKTNNHTNKINKQNKQKTKKNKRKQTKENKQTKNKQNKTKTKETKKETRNKHTINK